MENKTEITMEKDELLSDEKLDSTTPKLPGQVYKDLPRLLAESSQLFTDGTDKDIFLLSALTVLSSCLPQIEGTYFNRKLSSHLYLFISGPPATGKGNMIWSRCLAQNIHDEMRRESDAAQKAYNEELEYYENLPKVEKISKSKPEEPVRKMFFIPANCSTSALIDILAGNEFKGMIFETEADTLANAAKQDWGDSSDIFRKAFHHENTSMARRFKKELIEITNPHLAICLSGTPKQLYRLMPEVENGLFSRFMYYYFVDDKGFINPFISYQPIDYECFFTSKDNEVFHLYEKLNKMQMAINFQLTEAQGLRFTNYFNTLLNKNKMFLSRDLDATSKRLGVITFRIAMILSSLRLMELEPGVKFKSSMICTDADFQTAMTIATTLESHAVAVYQQMPKTNLKGLRLSLYESLPDHFDRKKYQAAAQELGINPRTADKYISIFSKTLLNHKYNEYSKN